MDNQQVTSFPNHDVLPLESIILPEINDFEPDKRCQTAIPMVEEQPVQLAGAGGRTGNPGRQM
jgi:hypothetical protein